MTLTQIIFWVLNDLKPSPLTPNSKMNQADMIVGIPAMVNCLVMVPFSIFFHYAYDVGPYIIDRKHHDGGRSSSGAEAGHHPESEYLHYQGGFLGIRAYTGMLNPSEFFGAIGFAFTMLRSRNKIANVGTGYDDVGGGSGGSGGS